MWKPNNIELQTTWRGIFFKTGVVGLYNQTKSKAITQDSLETPREWKLAKIS